MKAIKEFNGGLWAFRLVFAVVVAELLIVAGAVCDAAAINFSRSTFEIAPGAGFDAAPFLSFAV